MKKLLKQFAKSFLPALGWFVLSTVLLTLPGSSLPKEDWLDVIWFDKWVHTGMFAILAILLCRGIFKGKKEIARLRRYFIICGLLCLGYGVIMEFVQKYYIPNRTFDIKDILADGIGSALGVLFSIKAYIKK